MRMGTRNRPQESSENSRSAERTRAIEFFFSCWRALWVYRGRLPESRIVGASVATSHGVDQRISKIGMFGGDCSLAVICRDANSYRSDIGLPKAALTGSKASEDTDAEPTK